MTKMHVDKNWFVSYTRSSDTLPDKIHFAFLNLAHHIQQMLASRKKRRYNLRKTT